ncbi:TVP38/TMEM64 family protein [Coraliomargarita parva]|uniref:TVP38/TMEM64 family protein n=1 Tax=Coraliomargarita parva TaxID=3014050 RepID=UPI0022B489E8|nr:VTT domain-containing protein [Coraliomargarita parva]
MRERISIFLRLLALGLILGAGLYWLYRLDFDVNQLLESLQSLPGWGFLLAMCFLPVAGFPIAAFYLYAGVAYGFWEGWFYCCVALLVNTSLSYYLARHLLRVPLSALLARRGYSIPELSEVNAFRFVLLLRVVPGAPFFVQNYLPALMGVDFVLYLTVSLVTHAIISAGVVACGGLIPDHFSLWHLWVIGGIVLVLALLRWIQYQRRKTA